MPKKDPFHAPIIELGRQVPETPRNFFLVLETDEPLLATLKPKTQAVLRTEGPYVERARELNVPVGTLRSRLHRARARLSALRSQKLAKPK